MSKLNQPIGELTQEEQAVIRAWRKLKEEKEHEPKRATYAIGRMMNGIVNFWDNEESSLSGYRDEFSAIHDWQVFNQRVAFLE